MFESQIQLHLTNFDISTCLCVLQYKAKNQCTGTDFVYNMKCMLRCIFDA